MSTREAEALRRLFESVPNKAAFEREHKIPGGSSMVSQHLSGNRPISLEAAIAYARGFSVSLRLISPGFANTVEEAIAAGVMGPSPAAPVTLPESLPAVLDAFASLTRGRWEMVRVRLDALPEHPELRDDVQADVLPMLAPAVTASTKRRANGA